MLEEFKKFALRGNVVDMAVGIVIGGAFGKIVASFVNDVVMPPLGLLIGGTDFSRLSFPLKEATETAPAVAIQYGMFLNTVIQFLIIALAIFLVIRGMNSLRKKDPVPPPAPTEKKCPECLMLIPLEARRCAHCASAV